MLLFIKSCPDVCLKTTYDHFPFLNIKQKSCPICVQRQLRDKILKLTELKLSKSCPRTTLVDRFGNMRKVVQKLSQDNSRQEKSCPICVQGQHWDKIYFLLRNDSESCPNLSKDNSSQLIHYLHKEKVVQPCPRTTFVHIMISSRLFAKHYVESF